MESRCEMEEYMDILQSGGAGHAPPCTSFDHLKYPSGSYGKSQVGGGNGRNKYSEASSSSCNASLPLKPCISATSKLNPGISNKSVSFSKLVSRMGMNDGSIQNDGGIWNDGDIQNDDVIWNDGGNWNDGGIQNDGGIRNDDGIQSVCSQNSKNTIACQMDRKGGIGSGTQYHPLVRVGNRSKVETLLSNLGLDAVSLRRQVEALQLDLEAHINNEQRLQSLNQQLHDRLELYMKQNQENVERAELELNTLHEDMEKTLELQRRLAQRAASLEKEKKELDQALKNKLHEFEGKRSLLQVEITSLSDDVNVLADAQARADALQANLQEITNAKAMLENKLQNYVDEIELLKGKSEDYRNEINKIILEGERDKTVEASGRKCLTRRIFLRLKETVQKHHMARTLENAATEFANQRCSKIGLQALSMATARSKQLRLASNQQDQMCLQQCWRAWRLSNLANRKYKRALQYRKEARMWRILTDWKSCADVSKLSLREECQLTTLASKHRSGALKKKTLNYWKQWVNLWRKPLKLKINQFEMHLDRLLCMQVIATWRSFLRIKKAKRLKQACAQFRMRISCQRQAFTRWKDELRRKNIERLLGIRALQFQETHLLGASLQAWEGYTQWKKNRHIAKSLAFRHYLCILQKKSLKAWKKGMNQQQAERRAVKEVNRAMLRESMILWYDFHALQSIRKEKERHADVFRKRRAQKGAKWMLVFWWEWMVWKRRTYQLSSLMASRARHRILSNIFHCWIHCTVDHFIAVNVKCQNDLLEAKELFEEQKHQTTAVDVKNLQLIDRLHDMSSEIAHLKIAIDEKEKQEEDLKRVVEENTLIENSMKAELEKRHLQIEELELEVFRLQSKMRGQSAEDTADEVQYSMEIEQMENGIKNLQAELAQKSAQTESYAKALKETAERLDGTSDESQEQLSNALSIATSLRKLLEDRENQFASLEGDCRRRELELGEVQRKLAFANSSFSETLDSRDTHIHELENILAEKQSEVQDAHQELKNLQMTVDAKDSHARRLEYEIKLKTERESQRSKTFVSSLSSWSSSSGGQLDSVAGFHSNMHAIQLESMKHVYMQTKAALQQGINPDGCVSGYRLSAIKFQTKPSSFHWKSYGLMSLQEEQDGGFSHSRYPNKTEGLNYNPINCSGIEEEQEKDGPLHFSSLKGREIDCSKTEELLSKVQHQDATSFEGRNVRSFCPEKTKDGHMIDSFNDVAHSNKGLLATLPAAVVASVEGSLAHPCSTMCARNEWESGQGHSPHAISVEALPEQIDSLHVQIQQLQARIMSRLRDSPIPP